jgi:hypothetical protein
MVVVVVVVVMIVAMIVVMIVVMAVAVVSSPATPIISGATRTTIISRPLVLRRCHRNHL